MPPHACGSLDPLLLGVSPNHRDMNSEGFEWCGAGSRLHTRRGGLQAHSTCTETKLTVRGRERCSPTSTVVNPSPACACLVLSRTTLYRCKRLFDAEGAVAFRGPSRAPRYPRMALGFDQLEALRHLPDSWGWGPDRNGIATSYDSAVVHRANRKMHLSRSRPSRRVNGGRRTTVRTLRWHECTVVRDGPE